MSIKKIESTEKREYGIELLRIMLMFMIVIGHFFTHSGIREEVKFISYNWITTWLIQAFTVGAVNCFVLVTGFYQVKSKFKIIKIINLWISVFFYSVLLYFISCIIGFSDFSIGTFLKIILPITMQHYWFATTFIVLYITIPFLNKLLLILDKTEYTHLVLNILLLFYVLPTVIPFAKPLDNTEGMGIIGFVTLYIIGGYIRLHLNYKSCRISSYLYVLLAFLVFISKLLLEHIIIKTGFQGRVWFTIPLQYCYTDSLCNFIIYII